MKVGLFLIIYLIVVNIFTFFLMKIDKKRSRRNEYRISEMTFFMLSILLGSFGTYAGMIMFRHKTKHISFVIGVPLFIVLNLISIGFIIYKFII